MKRAISASAFLVLLVYLMPDKNPPTLEIPLEEDKQSGILIPFFKICQVTLAIFISALLVVLLVPRNAQAIQIPMKQNIFLKGVDRVHTILLNEKSQNELLVTENLALLPSTAILEPPKPIVIPEYTAKVVAASISVRTWSYDEIVTEMKKYDWPLEGAIATANCESGMNQFAVNRTSGARGLFQDISGDPRLDDPSVSINWAYAKWLDGGRSFYQHWTKWGGCGIGY